MLNVKDQQDVDYLSTKSKGLSKLNRISSSKDFFTKLNDNFRLTTVEVIYRMPDYQSILQEFVWQTLDRPPEYPRIYKFLEYWEINIEAPIYSVKIADRPMISMHELRPVDTYYKI